MDEDMIEEIRNKVVDVLKKYGIKRAALFGSIVRGEDTKNSDIGLLVEFKGERSLLYLVGLKLELQDRLKRDEDVITYGSIHPLLRERIVREQKVIL